jgi:hypothetical protein
MFTRTVKEVAMKRYLLMGMSFFLALSMATLAVAASKKETPKDPLRASALRMLEEGRETFRFDTFGDESFWGDTLKLHQAMAGSKLGGIGGGVSPKTALAVGLKVDMDALPKGLIKSLKAGKVNLDDPATTLALLKLNSVLGVKGIFDNKGALVSMGITCALCHSTVDDAFIPGIGHRRDGWPNRDLNVGVIASLAPNLDPVAQRLHTDVATVKKVFESWGPGKYDAEILEDGKAFRPDGKSAATLLPAAYGLAGVNLHTYGGWGSVTHWNAYVAVTQMHGKGTLYDPRMNDRAKYPLAVENKDWNVRSTPDLVTAKLAALHFYQLSLLAPVPPAGSFNKDAAARGEVIFNGKADCARCHVPPLFTEPGWNMRKPAEVGIDDFQALRSPDGMYRTTPLKGLWSRQKGGFFHDGRFATLLDVVNHYNAFLGLNLSDQDKTDLVEYLKSI